MPLFEIHDLSRAGDIRMRRRRAAMLLAGIVVVPWVLLQDDGQVHRHRSGRAERLAPIPAGPSRSLVASELAVDLPCASSVTIRPAPELAGRIIVSVRSGQEASLQALDMQGGILREPSGCSEGDFNLQAPPTMPLRVVQSGSADLHVGRFSGPVTVEATGSGDVVVEQAGAFTDQQESAADVSVGEVTGDVVVVLAGSGDLHIGSGRAGSLTATLRASGDLIAGGGTRFSDVNAMLADTGDLTLGEVTGHLDARTSGSGDIAIGLAELDTARLIGLDSGDILIRAGRIGTLTADRQGSGDLTVRAEIDAARVDHSGSGDVTLPHVTRLLPQQ